MPTERQPRRKGAAKPTASGAKRRSRDANAAPFVASPAATGPAGPLLEGHVGAQYLLALLSGGEARGLPGVVVTRVAFQRGGFNHPMDDVIVTGHGHNGEPATLELQAKRTIAFTPADETFADVVALACRAAAKPEFKSTRYELAVAIARTSTRIERCIQEVLRWAREHASAEHFFLRLTQPGSAHEAMREFVHAFRGHMARADADHADAAVWGLLSRFYVLAFDFEQPGSVWAQLARERCALQLAPRDVGRAGELWDSLQQIALQVDAAGGELDARTLRRRLTQERSYRFAGDRRLHNARERLAEAADNALAAIGSSVRGVKIDRASHVNTALSALEQGRYLEIRGAGGVGKSGVLKDLAELLRRESRVLVIAPHRVAGGGWPALQAQLGCDANARELLTDLALSGGGTLFIDGIDRFDDPAQRATVVDLLRAAAAVRGFRVVATARLDFDADARAWLPMPALKELGEAPSLTLDELGDHEVAVLRDAEPSLAALLRDGHPAEKLVRNLYRLERLARSEAADASLSEAQMARQWWTTGDGAAVEGRLERRRLLRSLAVHSLTSSAPLDASAMRSGAITALTDSGSVRLINSLLIEPAHDVLRDWAIGCLLYEEPGHIEALPLKSSAPMRLSRGIELAARLHAEFGSSAEGWLALLERVSRSGAHGSWKRAVLLALARSERAEDALNRCFPALASSDAQLLSDLVRAAITVDSQAGAPFWAALGIDASKLTDDFVFPRGPAWLNLIHWSLALGNSLPDAAVPQFVDLYSRWCGALGGQDPLSPLLVARLHSWLVQVEAKNHPPVKGLKAWAAASEAPGLSMTTAQEADLRTAFFAWSRLRPAEAESYLRGLARHPYPHVVFRQVLPFVGTLPYAAPQALADLYLAILTEEDREDDRERPLRDLFPVWDLEYFPASPTRPPFLDLLKADSREGLRLVRGVLAHAVRQRSRDRDPEDNVIAIPFPAGRRRFPWQQSYLWARDQDSQIVGSALMALEAWAHLRIEAGEAVQMVINDVLGPDESAAAFVLVAVDILLSHWPKTRECLWPFAASPELLAIDRRRFGYDHVNINRGKIDWVHREPAGPVTLEDLRKRPSRGSPLDTVLFQYGVYGPDELRDALRQALQCEVTRIGQPDEESGGMADPRFAAMCALNRLDRANYVRREDDQGEPFWEYVSPPVEARLAAKVQQEAHRGAAEVLIRGQLMDALTQASCPPALLERGVRWARSGEALNASSDADERKWIERTQLIVAALVLRDGASGMKATHGAWAREQLAQAANQETERSGIPKQLPYNTAAITAVGLLAAYRNDRDEASLRSVLALGARRDVGMVAVLRAEMAAQRPLLPEIARSLVRLGFASAIYAVPQHGDDDFTKIEDYVERRQAIEIACREAEETRLKAAIAAELRWLTGDEREPSWPELPDPNPPRKRRGIVIGARPSRRSRRGMSPRFAFDSASAAAWMLLAIDLWGGNCPDRLGALVRHCWAWTAAANGVGCARDEEPGERALEWSNAYFTATVAAGVSAGAAGLEKHVLESLAPLPEERFLDALEAVLRAFDERWLGAQVISDASAVSIRTHLASQLRMTNAWRRLASERSHGIALHAGGAVAAMFMGQHDLPNGPRCYVLAPGAARTNALLPLLTQLAEEAAGSTFVAMAFLDLLDVEPHTTRITFMARAVASWWRVQGADTSFWIDHGIGRRVCAWLDKAVLAMPTASAALNIPELNGIVDILVQCGTPLARALEERLAARRMEKGPAQS